MNDIEKELLDWTNKFKPSEPKHFWCSDKMWEYILGLYKGEGDG